ncbi:MAG: hypothetical protein HY226_02545 [Candidatus Vogelbacteria bacterium]|nr:hypothetical protein [Candidatus Vogelbacteria bacterium]
MRILNKESIVGDVLFAVQMALSWMFFVSQFRRAFSTTTGMTMTWALFCSAFVFVNLLLARGNYIESRSRKAWQVRAVYVNWLAIWLAILAPTAYYGTWKYNDSIVSSLILFAVAVLLWFRREKSLKASISEPITRGLVSLITKSVPQLFIAYCIWMAKSNAGLSGVALSIGHATVCIRIAEVYIMAYPGEWSKWSRNNQGLFISEVGNELTWLVTTFTWLVYNW